jgi:LytS/YehU family sensor histidine kinase
VLRLRIRAARHESDLLIEVANTGRWQPFDATRPDATGIGLENLRQRLQRYYPGAHTFATEVRDGWVVARLRFPSVDFHRALETTPVAAAI